MNETTMTVREPIAAPAPLSTVEVLNQVKLIQDIMGNAMKDGEHFGLIPGCGKKPTLLKAGAEKLCLTFRFAPSFEVDIIPLQGQHREYRVKTSLKSIVTGHFLGEGVGSCSTMESKYRYRKAEGEDTGKPVPKEYWAKRDAGLIGGKGFGVRKVEGEWHIVKESEAKTENPDIADQYNTVLKMAKKRSLVDAVLTATAASDIFTQDIEEIAENIRTQSHEAEQNAPAAPPARSAPPSRGNHPTKAETPASEPPWPEGDDPSVKSDSPPPAPPPAEPPPENCEGWRDVRIHFGRNGPKNGKPGTRLGDLNPRQLAWYAKDENGDGWIGIKKAEMKNGKKLSDTDLFLMAALLAMKKEMQQKEGSADA